VIVAMAGLPGVGKSTLACALATRLHAVVLDGNHPAGNRDAVLYRQLHAAAHPITGPKLVVNTGRPLAACVADCVAYATSEG
jgi:adenylate kinase family enzyme